MPGPLEGVRVIDLTAVLLGPFATQHLADMGADVIKVEPPEGDLLRVSGGSMGRDKSMGPIYMAANRNKRSLCLDLKKPAACAVLKDMIRTADLFIHNSRPQAIERLGLGYEDLKKINPSIIYAYSLGYARKGPYGHKPAFDDLVQGVSGAASLQSRVDGLPPRFMPSLIADKTTGLHLCIAVLGALYHRKCTGEGQMIEVPMLETLASFWLTEHLFGATWTPERGTMGYDRIINKFRHPFPTKDGYVCALPYTDAHWLTFFELAGRPDLAKEKKFVDRNERAKNFSELYQVLASLLEHRTDRGMAGAVRQGRHPRHAGAHARGAVRRSASQGDRLLHRARASDRRPDHHLRQPARFREDQGRVPPPCAAHRRDGVEVLREAGLSEAEIERLKADKALHVPPPMA